MNLYPLIKLLSNGQFQTGTQLGEQLGISRTAVWKQIKQLQALGLEVITKKNEGYSFAQPIQLLDTRLIKSRLDAAHSSLVLDFLPVVDSTNLELTRRLANKDLVSKNASANTLLIAEKQTAGRGRRGRNWSSPYAASLSLSLSFKVEGGANVLQGLSLAVGVVTKDVLSLHGIKDVLLKWPNDLYLNDAKLGGILIELSGDLAGPCNVIVGLGLNVFRTQQAIDVDQPVAYLSDGANAAICRASLAADLAMAIEKLLINYAIEGFMPWQEKWNAAHIWTGRKASIITPNKNLAVTLGGVTNTGELQVTYEDGSQGVINAGEVSVRTRL